MGSVHQTALAGGEEVPTLAVSSATHTARQSLLSKTQNGQANHAEVLFGFHYPDPFNHEGRIKDKYPYNYFPFFQDYLRFMPEEVALTSLADFWHWWYVFERYKGDEKGLAEYEDILELCHRHGLKAQTTIAWSTWWTQDRDWEEGFRMPVGPQDVDEWVHLVTLLGARFRGQVSLWNMQGEANNYESYWLNARPEHVHEIYKRGYSAMKRVDPGAIIGTVSASPSVSREKMDEWYSTNIMATAGYFDAIPVNYFADVADPYHGALNFYDQMRAFVTEAGHPEAEIYSGESSFQWAESTRSAGKDARFNTEQQARRANQTYGELFNAGMNKFNFWWTEFAPDGGHWWWRWGFRNFEDWWGIFPPETKVPGTQIVARTKNSGWENYNLTSHWARPADPYHPIWSVFKFWSQPANGPSEAYRLPAKSEDLGRNGYLAAAYRRLQNEAVVLCYTSTSLPLRIDLDLTSTGWSLGSPPLIDAENYDIDFRTGERGERQNPTIQCELKQDSAILEVPALRGFTTIRLRPAQSGPQLELVDVVVPDVVEVGEPSEAWIIVKNASSSPLEARQYQLASTGVLPAGVTGSLPDIELEATRAGGQLALRLDMPPLPANGRYYFPLRMRNQAGEWVGPQYGIALNAHDTRRPRKLVAFREVGHVRLKWFAPERAPEDLEYVLYRASGEDQPYAEIARTRLTDYIDKQVDRDRAYYYQLRARGANGELSRPTETDNARALATPRIMDAEIVAHNLPERVRVGDVTNVTIKIRNTGKKTWRLNSPNNVGYWLQPTQLWENQNEDALARIELKGKEELKAGEEIEVSFPYVGRKPGRFENHWVMYMEVAGTKKADRPGWEQKIQYAYFGTPLLHETIVTDK